MTLARCRQIRVPGSSANLGPGYDVLAAALSLHLEVEVAETGTFAVHTELDVARDRRNLVVRGFEALAPPDAFEFTIRSKIPLSGGLGSSAAAIVAGLLAADHIFELDADVQALATELEGHPDNVGAALQGGFVLCDGQGVHRFDPPMGLEAVLVVPHQPVRTAEARAAVPAMIPIEDAVFNVGAAGKLMLGLAGSDLDLIAGGLHDRLHQPYRSHLFPRSAELVELAPKLGALGATISGAGPTVLVWSHYEQTGALIEALGRRTGDWAQVIRAPFETQGAYVRGL
ncbi:MAG: homoserine kinase [Actinomycetota bacterium]|nr:homoserine kinase [Actinomycetota bacterium]